MAHASFEVLENQLEQAREILPLGSSSRTPNGDTVLTLGHLIIEETDTVGIEYGFESDQRLRFVHPLSSWRHAGDNLDVRAWGVYQHATSMAAEQIPIETIWRHSKTGGLYRVVGSALDDITRAPGIVYTSNDPSEVYFFRPVASWQASVEYNGQLVPRFCLGEA